MSRRVANKYSPHFSILISDDLAYFIRRYAFEEGKSMSEIFEQALMEWLIKHGVAVSREEIESVYQMEK